MKACTKCAVEQTERSFRMKKAADGWRRSTICCSCEKTYNRARAKDRKEARHELSRDEKWHVPLRPWPWAPGTIVFEDAVP